MKFFQFVLQYFQKVNPSTGQIYKQSEIPCDAAWYLQAVHIMLGLLEDGLPAADDNIIEEWYKANPSLAVKRTPWGWIETAENERKVSDLTVAEFEALLRSILGK